jgi:uncharacterized protein (TIGR03083 family)
MAQPSPWPAIHVERAALADDLASLTDAQWDTPSLCPGWSVRQVLGHMTATAKMTPGAFFAGLAGSGFRFNALSEKKVVEQCEGTPADTLARFREQINATTHPPGPVDSWLGETVVHSADIRRPLGIAHDYPADVLTRVAGFYMGSNLLIGGKKRAAGLTWHATDTDWRAGSGPEVSGPMLALVLAITGRGAVQSDLTGDGVATLATRF